MADKKYNEGVLTNDRQKITMKVCTQMTDKNYNETVHTNVLRYRMAGITESAMVAYTHKYAVV